MLAYSYTVTSYSSENNWIRAAHVNVDEISQRRNDKAYRRRTNTFYYLHIFLKHLFI